MQSLIESGGLQEVMGVLVGLCAVLMPVAIVFIVLHFRHRRSAETLATVRYLADKGLPVPADLLRDGKRERPASDQRAMLINALSMLGAGLGLMVFFYIWTAMRFLWGVGSLFAIIGVAQLIGLWLTRKQAPDDAGNGAV
ncbi:MAG: DUF6249 domain-containing protein [Caldimonas sp.]